MVDTISIRAQRYVANKAKGMSNYQAAVKAGYSKATAKNARRNIENRGVREYMDVALDKKGLTMNDLVRELKHGLEAKKPIVSGELNVLAPDHAVRHKYLETILKLTGYL